jgi:ribonuclease-3
MKGLEIAGYTFADEKLFETALTHSSYVSEHPDLADEDFERLEYLGDAVVDLVIGEEVYRRFPDSSEGELTLLRANLVSSAALAPLSRSLGLPERAHVGRGMEETAGRSRRRLAASLYESFIGAVYVDGGFEAARRTVLSTMNAAIERITVASTKSAKSLLQEWAHSEKLALPTYSVLQIGGPENQRDFVVEAEVEGKVARGNGSSKRDAEEAAAANLLKLVTT